MEKINWGIIGCGDVTEVKSGPAFNKVKNSQLIAVMRRDAEKAKDYALRHNVPKWYADANKLINDPDVNAVYVATPPSSHEEYTMAALQAGKPVYVEKPMALNAVSADKMVHAAKERNIKLSVAHYRRAQPVFKKIKQLLDKKVIGDIRFVKSELYKQSFSKQELVPKTVWRVDPSIAGGGIFHDLAPHQFGLMYYFFGEPEKASGISLNQAGLYTADDTVAGNILFKNGVLFNGVWCFNVSHEDEKDSCEIFGEKGKISFSFFNQREITVIIDGKPEVFAFDILQHVQQPMIEKVVEYFLDQGPNPCSGEEGVVVMKLIDEITKK
ncbi:MAG TPA: Gfo/Idh/MocA family oxidoreductase [Chitinophagaceae bacterium]|jgi:predicted dehydrogenase|nr:Gfo/Idh/MocA family oxidoreductase [Chitinophagaceae bacterium]